MGFFSSSKKQQHQNDQRAAHSVVQAIRYRFYAKRKFQGPSPSNVSPAPPKHFTPQIRHSNGPTTNAAPSASQVLANATRDITPAKPRPVSDAITMTLAQRLNELAVANSEGLLDDDEYRLLRQNLFERFASGVTVPAETPVVPVANETIRQSRRPSHTPSESSVSNNYVTHSRTPSIRSKASVTSTMTSLFRRATTLGSSPMKSHNANESDSSSIFSAQSTVSQAFLRPTPSTRAPTKKGSKLSLRSKASHTQLGGASSSSAMIEFRSGSIDQNASMTSLPRSTGRRALPTSPPSSFPSRLTGIGSAPSVGADAKHGLRGVFDADHLITAGEIRKEIEAVQGEEKRLLDAFNGLEMTAITRYQNRLGHLPPPPAGTGSGSGIDSTWTLIPDRRQRHNHHHQQQTVVRRGGGGSGGNESDTTSVFSSDSCQTTPSLSVAPPRSLRRLFASSKAATIDAGGRIPPSASGTSSLSPAAVSPTQLDTSSSTSLSLSRSNSQKALRALAQGRESSEYQSQLLHEEEDEDTIALDKELNDIRRRREDVTARYEARLDYLRAKLKGAEIHEKLMRN